jgi:hypothetical protein
MGRIFVPSGFTGSLPTGRTILTSTRFSVTDAELVEYANAHAPKPKPGASTYKKDQEF